MDALVQLTLGMSAALGLAVVAAAIAARGPSVMASLIVYRGEGPERTVQEVFEPELARAAPRSASRLGAPPAWASRVGGAAAVRRPAAVLAARDERELPDEVVVPASSLRGEVHRRS